MQCNAMKKMNEG